MRTGKLSDLDVKKAKPGVYGDGGNLWLQVTGAAARPARSWLFRFSRGGRERWMGLGPYPDVTLREARDKAQEARMALREGKDPIEDKRVRATEEALAAARSITFRQCAEAYISAHQSAWRNQTHAAQWPATLQSYIYPTFGDLPVQSIDVALVMKAIEPIWLTKTETASRLRGRIESVLDWATVRGFRAGENPARWRGHLDHLLPERSKVKAAEHHPALAYSEMPKFMAVLRARTGIAARALEFGILTAARRGEIMGATWSEIDLDGEAWSIPGSRMKAGKDHRVPLSKAALTVLHQAATISQAGFIFPGSRAGRSMSPMAIWSALQRMNRDKLTPHGFRSTFRDWAAERTNFPREVAEQALAHALPDKVEAAYRRSDLFEKRRELMEAWARFCGGEAEQGTTSAKLRLVSGT